MEALTRRILEYVRDNPGGTTVDIAEAMSSRYSYETVWFRIVHLQSAYEIENRGGAGRVEDVRWHIIEWEPTEFFLEIASDCLKDLEKISPRKRVKYLARRIQKLNENIGGTQ